MVFPSHTVTTSAQETKKLGAQLGAYLLTDGDRAPRVLCLYGQLGSGKTTFVQGVAQGFGIQKRLLSPTFIIVRHYVIPAGKGYLYHADFYRLQKEQEIVDVGLHQLWNNPHVFVCIEWPERLSSLLPKKRLDIHCVADRDGTHDFVIDQI